MGNGFALFISGWTGGVGPWLDGLFSPDNERAPVLLNEGVVALLWLVIGALVTNLISRVALPVNERRALYRRSIWR
ncbi:hypothetical protein V1227_09495 [Lentzea sp. DG1S-22]|uniref:hypothetical protein n=1 Tax=Lentzea sp. DG1S-22 TaxID=3108822 RepID=UPI002E77AA93|nr:hypothetical protein [Lentzea sp. DG1S-22]WVH82962.1 hypothetical protein V1227_09495 [Lentzea sp. DG1S-22]